MKRNSDPVKNHFQTIAKDYDFWKNKSWYYYAHLKEFYSRFITNKSSVLEVGCGTGDILASLCPVRGVGIDISPLMISIARKKHPPYSFFVDNAESPMYLTETFDRVIVADLVEHVYDFQIVAASLRKFVKKDGLVIITSINPLWSPIFHLAEKYNLKMPEGPHCWISLSQIINIVELSGFTVTNSGFTFLFPKHIPFISSVINRVAPMIPLLRRFCIVQYLIAKPARLKTQANYSCSIIIPCFNEESNINETIRLAPQIGASTEIIVIDDGSTDTTLLKAKLMQKKYRNLKVVSSAQNRGKALAVKAGIAVATGDILIIWDADRTVPAEELYKFYDVLASGQADFANGTRMVYLMEKQAMKTLNILGNVFFGSVYSWIFQSNISDTLCGTKALFRKHAMKMTIGTERWGDFDLLFGAKRLGIKIKEVPVHYKMRLNGTSKMQRISYGVRVGVMAIYGLLEFKILPLIKK